MASDRDETNQRLQRLHGRMKALSEAMAVLGEESAKVAAFQVTDDSAPMEEQLDNGRELVALSVQAVRACALRINDMFEAAKGEYEEIKIQLAKVEGGTRH